MLCGETPHGTIEQLQRNISSDLSLPMSILLADTLSIPPPQAADRAMPLHQSNSGQSFTRHWPAWWNWLDRPFQRIALRNIADDPHLLSDIGLTREQALHEATKPFWR
jgi:uncharacterized protein YjiS (DUF1127 family)